MMPLPLTGFNRDLVIEDSASGPPYTAYAQELNPGEGKCFYQSGLAGTVYGLPPSGSFISEVGDNTIFQFQPYTSNNALVLSSGTGLTSGSLTLDTPILLARVAFIANSASGGGTSDVTLHFNDGSTFTTNYNAPDWFNNSGYALQGVERINLSDGGTQGAPNNPRFYQTTINLSDILGAANKPLASLEFSKASGAGSTAIYAVSGEVGSEIAATITANPADTAVGELASFSFSASASGYPVPVLRWLRNGVPIPGATNGAYLMASAPLSDNNALFSLVASNIANSASHVVTSTVARLTVIADTNPPVLLGAFSSGLNQVQAQFSERIRPADAANKIHYVLTDTNGPVSISNATLDISQSNVVLNVAPLTEGAVYTLKISNLEDQSAAANIIAPNSQATFTASTYAPAAIGGPTPPGGQLPFEGGLQIFGGGNDLGGAGDQFQFSYVSYTGDFDFKVRVASLAGADAWSEAGLAAREDLSPGARSASVVATPSISGCYFQYRITPNAATTLAGSYPANYPNTWLRLKRAGNIFTGYAGFDGATWSQLGASTIAMPSTVYFGFAVSSHNSSQLATATFQDLSPVTAAGTSPALTVEPLGQSSRRTSLVISEIMYHPTNAALEFVELFNSRGEPQDMTGYKLGGSVNYTFPPGATLPGGGFLVIAKSPADLQSAYGISGVLGPFSGSLPNDSGEVQLITQSGGVVLDVNYSDHAPWPVAADGAGHSLVLARASFGEDNPLAWSASGMIGGSPGALDPFPSDPLRNVVINEFLAHTDYPDLDYIELYNHGGQPLDISGYVLTDDPDTNKFIIPLGTTIPAHGFVSYTEADLHFALDASGESIFFKNPAKTRVLDAIRFEAQENGVSMGRYPDGGDEFHRLAAKTPGSSNAPIRISDIVINELMYQPLSGNDDDQYVELYNRGTNSVSLGGWTLDDGINFTFPTNTILAPGHYLVAAKSVARLLPQYANLNAANTLGDFSGSLSGKGERISLRMPDTITSTNGQGVVTTNLIHIAVDEVNYGAGGRWPEWADGGGSSLELINPGANHRLPSNWAASDETHKAPWSIVTATGTVDNTSLTADQLQILLPDAGECLVDSVQVLLPSGNLIANSDFETDASGWTAEGTESGSSLETAQGYTGSRSYHIRAVERGDNEVNRVRAPLTSTIATGTTNVTIKAAVRWLKGPSEILLRLRGNGLECDGAMALPVSPGTPGMRNSAFVSNAPPAIVNVSHSPILPAASQQIIVTANVQGADGLQPVLLKYRVDPGSTYTPVVMNDTGAGGDAVAGDGIYSGSIPGQPSGTMLAFYIQAASAATPSATAFFPNDAPARECLIRVGETQPVGNFPVYRIWMTQATLNAWSSRNKLVNTPFDVTFVLGNDRVIYNARALYAGSPYIAPGYSGPASGRCGYSISFPKDDLFLGETDLVLDWPGGHGNETTALQEQMGYWIADRLAIPFSHRYIIRLHVNGVTDDARQQVFEAVQQPAKGFISEWLPNAAGGQFYKIERGFEFNDSGGLAADPQPRLQNITTTGGAKKKEKYRWWFVPRAGTSYSDFTNLFSLVDAMNSSRPSPYTGSVDAQVDVEEWMRILATEHIIVNFDAYGHEIGKNMYAYLPPGGKWQLYMFDLDWLMLAAQLHNSSYAAGSAPLFNSEDPTISTFYAFPPFVRAYWRAIRDAVNGPLAAANCNPIMDAKYASLLANGIAWCDGKALTDPSAVKTWFSQRRTYLQSQLATVSPSFSVNQTVAISNGLGVVTGVAPVDFLAISINGVEWPVTWTSVNAWTALVPLRNGSNSIAVAGIDQTHQPIAGATNLVSVIYNGAVPAPVDSVVINEIMFNPLLPGAEYVELFNTSFTNAFDLSGWNFNGLSYDFPGGSVINPRGFLVLAKDRVAFDQAYGPAVNIFDTFSGSLQNNGETLSLIMHGAADLVVDRVRYETNAPWPAAAAGSSLQVIDPARDNSRVGDWAAGTTNTAVTSQWVYVSTNVVATSSRLYIYLLSAGDIYIDDIQLVAGAIPEAGQNYVTDGDFETALGTTWNRTANFSSSALSSTYKHSGNSSLHVIATAAGSGSNNSIYQNFIQSLVNGSTYTLSFWYRQSTNGGPLVLRLSNATVTPTFNPAPPAVASTALFTPGAANSVAANLPSFPTFWLNEIQLSNLTGPADNFGEHDAWVEIFNSGSSTQYLDGLYLGTNASAPALWAFPSNLTIAPSKFMVVWLDGQPQQTSGTNLHASFKVTSSASSLLLSRYVGANVQVADYLNPPALQANYAYGDFPDGQPFYRQALFNATPWAANNSSLPPITVFFNEWMADNAGFIPNPASGKFSDWFELYNSSDSPAQLAGYYLTDTLTNRTQYQVPAGYTIPAHGYLMVWADGKPSDNSTNSPDLHTNFKMSKTGEALGLFAPDGNAIDYVNYGAQASNVSQGRYPDGGGLFLFMPQPSPRAANILPPSLQPPSVTSFTASPDSAVQLSFQSVPGHTYRVEYKDDLSAPAWTPLGSPIFATDTIIAVQDTNPSPSQRYYRVVQVN